MSEYPIFTPDQESEFLEFERQRLLYVAATRAGTRFVISQKEKGNKSTNHWAFFDDHLGKCPPLPDPGHQSAPVVTEVNLSPEVVEQAAGEIAEPAPVAVKSVAGHLHSSTPTASKVPNTS